MIQENTFNIATIYETLQSVYLSLNKSDHTTIAKANLNQLLETLTKITYQNKKIYINAEQTLYYQYNFKQIIRDLELNIAYLTNQSIFKEKLIESHLNVQDQLEEIKNFLHNKTFDIIISDRDGTLINDYENYFLSFRPFYNTSIINEWMNKISAKQIILSSSSLKSLIMLESTLLQSTILAGSNGMEYLFSKKTHHNELTKDKEQLWNNVIEVVNELEQSTSPLNWIRSGIQFKFGQIIISYSDNKLGGDLSRLNTWKNDFYHSLKAIKEWDKHIVLFDNGTELFINLKPDIPHSKPFFTTNKQTGLEWINSQLTITANNALVLGNHTNDLPILNYLKDQNIPCAAIFITRDEKLKAHVKQFVENSIFITEPDIFLASLY